MRLDLIKHTAIGMPRIEMTERPHTDENKTFSTFFIQL